MKKPNVLNRAMFNQGGTSAYGKGITSNLVSDEQRQRYNYGGRVGYQNRGYVDYMGPTYQTTDPSQKYGYSRYLTQWPKSEEDLRTFKKLQFDKIPRWQDVYSNVYAEDVSDIEDLGIEKPYISASEEEQQDIEFKRKMDERSAKVKEMRDVGLVVPGEGPTPAQEFGTPVVEEKEEAEVISKGPMGDEMWDQTTVRDDTDELDTPDRWAFLDENIAKKKKLARGHALMEGAAAAADFAVAATPEKRGAAIAKGLRGVGTIGTKYKGGAEDLKTKAQVLGAIEDIKGERKEKQFEKQQEGYYDKLIEIRQGELQLKKDAAALKELGASNKDVYVALSNAGKLNNPAAKATLLSSFIGKQIQMAADEKEVKQFSAPENDGVVFMDIKGRLWRNTKGDVQVIDIWQDTEFLGE